jgi:hypothetical protein
MEAPKPIKPDPGPKELVAAVAYRSGQSCTTGWTKKQCERYKVARLDWIPSPHESAAATIADPLPKQRDAKPHPRQQRQQQQYQQQQYGISAVAGAFDPIGEFINVVTLPIRFATYPARRNW